MKRLFEPVWAGGWTAARLCFAVAVLWGHWPRLARVEDAYACTDMLFTTGPWQLANYVVWTPTSAYALWTVGLLGIMGLFLGGRFFRPGMFLYLLGAWALLGEEAINVKAHDRLSLWVALGLCLSPAHERSLGEKWRSPVARYFLLIVFGWLYWSTGSLKLLEEPAWRDGTAMQYALLHRFHAGGPLALWLSKQALACRLLGWFTVAFEMSFPLLVLWRRSNPWVLACGAAFHLGVLALMNVGAFSAVALSAYPALLHPEVARGLWTRLRPRLPVAALALVGCAPAEPEGPPTSRDLVLVYVDTLRADRLGTYGHDVPTSPTLDRLAQAGVRFDAAYTPSPWTFSATASVFTGLLPAAHGAKIPGDIKNEARAPEINELDPRFTTLAEAAADAGFATALFARNGYLGHGVDQGFERVDNPRSRRGSATVAAALDWLDDVPREKRAFLAVHLMDSHVPTRPSRAASAAIPGLAGLDDAALERASRFDRAHGRAVRPPDFELFRTRRLASYDAAIRDVDAHLAALLEGLGDRRRDALLVFTADHGEEFWEHADLERALWSDPRRIWGMGHGHSFFEELMRVPLVIHQAGVISPAVVTTRVSTVGLFPTLTELLGLPTPSDIDGESFVSLLRGEPGADTDVVFDEVCFGLDKQGMRRDGLKLIRSKGEATALFDLAADPAETTNVAQSRPDDVARLGETLDEVLAQSEARGRRWRGDEAPRSIALGDEEVEHLRALGYLDGD